VGEFSAWVPIGAVQTASGYYIALEMLGANTYGFWTIDSNGNFTGSLTGNVSGTNLALEQLELVFNQDINGDGFIGSHATVINVTGDVFLTLSPIEQAITINAGATLELAGADTGSLMFDSPTGTLILDHSSEFSGQVFNFPGNGSLSSSDQTDLKDIEYGTGMTASYTGNVLGGTLSVTDAHDNTASISFSGNYINSIFSISSEGNGGTLVVDPAVTQALASGTFLFNESDSTGKYTVSAHRRVADLAMSGALQSMLAIQRMGKNPLDGSLKWILIPLPRP
jgi:hypothetical protein